jgi:hypothetical protein
MTKEVMQQALEALKDALDKPMWNRLNMEKAIQALEKELKKKQFEHITFANEIIEDLQSQYDTEGITEDDSGDELIRLRHAISTVQNSLQQYTTPQQRKPLTSEQIDEIYYKSDLNIDDQYNQMYAFVKAIEAKLKEKNET